jgi:hypothetical protein
VPDLRTLQEYLAGSRVDAAVFALWPDYRAMLLAALHAAADDLVAHLTQLGPGVRAVRHLITVGTTPGEGN